MSRSPPTVTTKLSPRCSDESTSPSTGRPRELDPGKEVRYLLILGAGQTSALACMGRVSRAVDGLMTPEAGRTADEPGGGRCRRRRQQRASGMSSSFTGDSGLPGRGCRFRAGPAWPGRSPSSSRSRSRARQSPTGQAGPPSSRSRTSPSSAAIPPASSGAALIRRPAPGPAAPDHHRVRLARPVGGGDARGRARTDALIDPPWPGCRPPSCARTARPGCRRPRSRTRPGRISGGLTRRRGAEP